jgi:L-amino acid N-acyltransferase YncA
MLLNIKELAEIDSRRLMDIYEEDNYKNIKHFFPECENQEEGIKKVEEGFINYIQNEFLKLINSYYFVWEENNLWVSALRLYKIEEGIYFLEALETHPGYRKKGYAQKLICNIIEELKKNGNFTIKSCVDTDNVTSLKTHKKCGFVEGEGKPFDYTTNEYVEDAINLCFSYSA